MTQEQIQELWKASQWVDENTPRPNIDDVVEEFARKLYFEAAKIVCFRCAKYGASAPTPRNPQSRYHEIHGSGDYTLREPCEAARFYL